MKDLVEDEKTRDIRSKNDQEDGQELPGLIEKVWGNGIEVTEVIGDMAYVSEENLEACGEEISLIARTNTTVAAAANRKLEEGFCYNKDAGMLQCPVGELFIYRRKKTPAKKVGVFQCPHQSKDCRLPFSQTDFPCNWNAL